MKGNDLRFNVYLKKMEKLTRMDIGLDVEAYKDYVNNLKIFAKYHDNLDIMADDDMTPKFGPLFGKLGIGADKAVMAVLPDDFTQRKIRLAQYKESAARVKRTVKKLMQDFWGRLNNGDRAIVEEFVANPEPFLEADPELCILVRHLQ